jgi:hypothetical protein
VISGVANVNVPLALTIRLSPPLFCSTKPEPLSPVALPPTVNWFAVTYRAVSVLLTPPPEQAARNPVVHSNNASAGVVLGQFPVVAMNP